MNEQSAKARYTSLAVKREHFLDRARDCAELTIPSLLPREGHHPSQRLIEPAQSVGAECVLNLASRLMMALYPPGQPSFKLGVPADVLLAQGQESVPADLERGLTLGEQTIAAEIERRQWRHPTHLSLLYMIVTGNALEQMLPDNRIKVFRIDQYVVVRDPSGQVTEIITEEFLFPANMPDELRSMVDADEDASQPIPLYTWVKLKNDGTWEIHQEIQEETVPNSKGTWQILPFNALRWTAVVGEDYGRGKCEEHIGDLRSVEGLSKAVIDGAAMASRHVTMIRPNAAGGLNLRRRLAKAANGEFVVGNPEDIEMLQFTNVTGMQFTEQALVRLIQSLSRGFLLNSSVRRDAERVTAYELQLMAEELEGTLGGVYSMLAQEMQAARLRRLIFQMQDQGALPDWPEGVIEPTILTGLESLGRQQDVQKVATLTQLLAQLPPEVATDYPKWSDLLKKVFNGLQLPEAVRTDEEVAQIQQQRAMAEAAAQAMGQTQQPTQGQPE